jgi:hypothetical protein
MTVSLWFPIEVAKASSNCCHCCSTSSPFSLFRVHSRCCQVAQHTPLCAYVCVRSVWTWICFGFCCAWWFIPWLSLLSPCCFLFSHGFACILCVIDNDTYLWSLYVLITHH